MRVLRDPAPARAPAHPAGTGQRAGNMPPYGCGAPVLRRLRFDLSEGKGRICRRHLGVHGRRTGHATFSGRYAFGSATPHGYLHRMQEGPATVSLEDWMIQIAIIEDNRLVRDGLTLKLNEQEGFEVIHSAAMGCIDALGKTAPRVLLLDAGLEGEDSRELAERVRDALPNTRVIVMDLLPVHEELVEFVTAGVAGFVLKDATLEESSPPSGRWPRDAPSSPPKWPRPCSPRSWERRFSGARVPWGTRRN
ncbi:MAG: DNA-binding response regulator [Gemmatimonadales bacterium]|nr:MAG: DNA-binding response regulator [Gemmatimonadales bacterium]